MELQTAIEILSYHQEWRLGKRDDMIHEPRKLTEAIDVLLMEVKKLNIASVVRPVVESAREGELLPARDGEANMSEGLAVCPNCGKNFYKSQRLLHHLDKCSG